MGRTSSSNARGCGFDPWLGSWDPTCCCWWLVAKSCVTLLQPQAPLSMVFPRQEYWSGLPFPPSRDLPDQGIEPCLLHWQADSLPLSHQGNPDPICLVAKTPNIKWKEYCNEFNKDFKKWSKLKKKNLKKKKSVHWDKEMSGEWMIRPVVPFLLLTFSCPQVSACFQCPLDLWCGQGKVSSSTCRMRT